MKDINIERNQKIRNFMEISKINDKDLAKNYLISVNWDESQAINNYFSRKDKINFINDKDINLNRKEIQNQNNSSNSNDDNNNEGFLSKYIFSPIFSLFSSCYSNHDSDLEEESKIFHFLPNKIQDFSKFNQFIKKYIGIIIFYDRTNLEFLEQFINKICRNSSIMKILRQKCVIFPILSSNSNGYKLLNILSELNLSCPSLLFCFDKSNENIFGKNNINKIIDRQSINIDIFYKSLIQSLSQIEQNNSLNNSIIQNNQENNNYNYLTDGEILQKQRNDMEELEKNVQNMEDAIKTENIKKKENLDKIEKEAEKYKTKFISEPDKNNPDCCTICFRYPDGDKRRDRRFLKTDKIKILYEYVKSLGNEIYTEDENCDFSLYQPFPPKKYDNMENTLENEELFPNAVIQIKEE